MMIKKLVVAGLHRAVDATFDVSRKIEPLYDRMKLYEKLSELQNRMHVRFGTGLTARTMTLEERLELIEAVRVAYHESLDFLAAQKGSVQEAQVARLAALESWEHAIRLSNELSGLERPTLVDPVVAN
jgi:hypothetical protein